MVNQFEFLASLVAFFILLAGLKYVLYNPLVEVAKDRESQAKERIKEAEEILKEAQAQAQEWREKTASLEGELAQISAKAQEDVANLRREVEAQAQKEADSMLQGARVEAVSLQAKGALELRRRVAAEVSRQAEKLVRASLDPALQRNIVENFLAKMEG